MANETAWKQIGPPELEISELHPEVLGRDAFEETLRDRLSAIDDQIAQLRGERAGIVNLLRRFDLCSYCGAAPIHARGLCRNCYERALRNGDPEPRRRGKKPTRKIQSAKGEANDNM